MAGLSIDILANTRQAQGEVKDLGKALDDVGDSLDDVARDSDAAAGKLERNFRDMVDDAKKAEKAVEDIGGKGATDGFDKASDSAEEFKGEALANFSEVVSSFDGSMTAVGDLAQGTFGGLAALGGGFGLAAGAAATGVGLITTALEQAEERRKELEQKANDLASAYIEAGNTVIDAATIASSASSILTDPAEKKKAQELADALGIDLSTAVRTMALDQNALALANGIVSDSEDEYFELMGRRGDYITGGLSTAETKRFNQLDNQRQKMAELNGITDSANDTFKQQQDVLFDLIKDADTATVAVDKFGNELIELPDGTKIVIDAETKTASTNISNFAGDLDKKIPTVKTIDIVAKDKATEEVDRIVRKINGKVATITIKSKYGTRQAL
jgi:hypothetical protein